MKLPDPPPLNPAPAMSLDQFYEGERAVSIRACQAYARLYAKEYGEAVREACARVLEDEIERAEALMNLHDGGAPVFNAEQTEAGICALRTVAEAIRRKEE